MYFYLIYFYLIPSKKWNFIFSFPWHFSIPLHPSRWCPCHVPNSTPCLLFQVFLFRRMLIESHKKINPLCIWFINEVNGWTFLIIFVSLHCDMFLALSCFYYLSYFARENRKKRGGKVPVNLKDRICNVFHFLHTS